MFRSSLICSTWIVSLILAKASQNVGFIFCKGGWHCLSVLTSIELMPTCVVFEVFGGGALFPSGGQPCHSQLVSSLWQHHMQANPFHPMAKDSFLPLAFAHTRWGEGAADRKLLPADAIERFDGGGGGSCWIHGCMGQLNTCSQKGARKLENKMQTSPPRPTPKIKWRTCAQRTFQPLAVQIHGCEKCN